MPPEGGHTGMDREEGSGPAVHQVEFVAAELDLHPQTVRRLARERKLPMWKLGGQWVMSDVDLQRLLNARDP